MKSIEIETTFLASQLPNELEGAMAEKMVDIYIPQEASFPVLRLRQKGETYEITKKVPVSQGDYSSHTEHTIALTADEFTALQKASNRSVQKNRFTVSIEGHKAEVDVFSGPLQGLVVIDFEFDSSDERDTFKPPYCCLADVTQEKFILGGQLAGRSYDDIAVELKRFNYQKLL